MGTKRTEEVERSRKKHQIVEIKLRVPLPQKEKIRSFAQSKGKTLAGYIKELIAEDMAKG